MLRECFNDFIGHLRLERGLSLRTAKAYGSDMELFIRYLESLHIDEWEEVRRDDIADFLEADPDHRMEPTTIARRLVSIKVFFRYLVEEQIVKYDITDTPAGCVRPKSRGSVWTRWNSMKTTCASSANGTRSASSRSVARRAAA